MGFERSIRADGTPRLSVSNDELARMVAHLGIAVQKLTARVAYLEGSAERVAARNARQQRRREQAQKRARAAVVTERAAEKTAAYAASRADVLALLRRDKPRSIAEIIAEVATEYQIRVKVIIGRSLDVNAVVARQEVYLRARDAGYSFAAIGQAVGRDHSTVLHGMNVAALRRSKAVEHV